MDTAFFIAFRYLFARKSHNVINVISAISAIGMAVGTAALILILSVYNGFDSIIRQNLSDLDPDVLLTRAGSRFFAPEDSLHKALLSDGRIESVSYVLEDNVFLVYGSSQGIAKAKGVDWNYSASSGLSSHIIDGEFSLYKGEIEEAVIGSGLAQELGLRPRFITPLTVYYPDKDSKVSIVNPSASLRSRNVKPAGIFSISSDIDAGTLILPIETMQILMGGEDLVSAVELRLRDKSSRAVREFISNPPTGVEYTLSDRLRQHPEIYRMMKYEKAAVFLILIFVVIIVAFNIFGSLSMLMIEKEDDIETLKALGAGDRMTRKIFILNGWMISMLGMAAGLAAGIAIALLQQKFGLVKMPGSFLMDAYPVVLQAGDILLTAAGVAAIGFVIALTASKRH